MFTLPETLVYLQVCHYRLHFKIVQYELFLPSSARRRPLMCRTHFESPHNGPVGLLQPIALHRGPTAVLPIELRYLLIFPVSRRAATVFTAPGWSLAAARRPLSFSSSGPPKNPAAPGADPTGGLRSAHMHGVVMSFLSCPDFGRRFLTNVHILSLGD